MRKKKLTTVSLENMFDSDEENAQVLQIPTDILNPEGELEKKQRIKILRKIVEKIKSELQDASQITILQRIYI